MRDGAAVSAGEIVGVVKDEKGRPLSRVAAILQAEGTDTEQRITTTDADGVKIDGRWPRASRMVRGDWRPVCGPARMGIGICYPFTQHT